MPYKDYAERVAKTIDKTRAITAAAQDIAPVPPIVDKARRRRCVKSFRAFCETYFGDVFYLPWSKIHLDVIAKIERVISNGEIFALAMPRGSGKTTLNQLAVLWAAITGRAEFIVLIAANASRADSLLEDIKVWLETNDKLNDDFPEVCYPIRRLERNAQRQRGQHYKGQPTRINWRSGQLVLPTMPGSKASGVCIMSAGMSGSDIRGLSYTRADGRKIRPSLALIDDPQTRESAQSETQCATIEKIIKADVLGMAGAGKKLACCITMTVVAENDVAQRLLDRARNPEFRGERYQLMDAFPVEEDLWEQYRQIREAELQSDGSGEQATAFYVEHREKMDRGAVPTWEARFNVGEVSAIQYAMNLKFRDEASFLSEYQNQPVPDGAVDDESFSDEKLVASLTGQPRGFIPAEHQFLTGFIDVHKNLLFWTICSWDTNFNGTLVDYGVYPEQKRRVFLLKDARPALPDLRKTAGLEGQIYGGLQDLVENLFQRQWVRDDGTPIEIERLLIDANWGPMTDTVYQFISESPWRARLLPSHGVYVGAASKPFSEYAFHPGDRAGLHWRIPNEATRRRLRRVLIDTNYWKTFLFSRLNTARGDQGRVEIDGSVGEHALLLEHLTAERCVAVEAKGKRVDEWQTKPQRDNHWLDCLTGTAVGASICGVKLTTARGMETPKRKKVSFAELQRMKARGR